MTKNNKPMIAKCLNFKVLNSRKIKFNFTFKNYNSFFKEMMEKFFNYDSK